MQLRLVFSNSKMPCRNVKLLSVKCRMSRVSWSRLPSVAQKVLQLHESDPIAAVVIEKLVDDALRRRAGNPL